MGNTWLGQANIDRWHSDISFIRRRLPSPHRLDLYFTQTHTGGRTGGPDAEAMQARGKAGSGWSADHPEF